MADFYDPALKTKNIEEFENHPQVTIINGSLLDLPLNDVIDGVDVVFHLAGQPGVRTSWGSDFALYVQDNVLATQRLLEACAEARQVKRFVYASSSSVYGDALRYPTSEDATPRPVSPYGVTKLAAEHLVLLYCASQGFPAVALRYFTIYGPRQRPDMAFSRFMSAALSQKPVVIFGDGHQVREFTYVSDCVSATVAAATNGTPGGVYNIAGGSETTVLEVLEMLEELCGSRIQRDHRPPVPGDARRTGADTRRAEAELDFRPAVSLREGLMLQYQAVTRDTR
jgi:nucleoside-diphosphate-sugar epimerase